MIAPARRAAFGALLAHEVKGADLPAAIATARHALRDARDQTLLTELVTGTVRMRLAVDHQLGLRTSRPIATLDDEVRTALRMGAFQLMYLDRLPPSAVVDDAVSLTRRAGKTSAAGLVNAVLRSLARERQQLAWPETPDAHALATRYSHPEWLVSRWLARHGPERTRTWLAFDNEAPRLCLAVNRLRATRDQLAARLAAEGIETRPTSRAPNGLVVVRGAALGSEAFRDGWFVVQDEASQLVAELGPVSPGQRVLDLCAAPGGKTVALLARVGPTGRVVACDVRARRIRLLKATLVRTGHAGVPVIQIPADGGLPFAAGRFDLVLIDAPCSGLGTLRRDPDIRWRRQESDLVGLAARQRLLLRRAAPLVRPGGILLYATCSSEPDENEAVVSAFLADADAFALRHEHRTTPPDDGLEAFYGAVIARTL
ncbi:MAG: 16S rRNA (cytosine(967)-C(5))-methyltransferase RsmB [Acidobacteria bacterium]|nr:16S rRNA (cytosine(967)-C(5))-methyltransferase RsmB [Acidobacteriota bacterium]